MPDRSETEPVRANSLLDVHDGFDDAAQPGLRMRLRGEARRLSTQHARLDTFCEMVSEALQRGSLSAARMAFMRFSDALDAHVTLEDQVFFPALRGLRPDLTEPLTRLVREHTKIRHDLEQLRDLLSAGSAEAFDKDFSCLCDFIREHERVEHEVLRPARDG